MGRAFLHILQEEFLTLNLPTATIVAQPFIKWQLKFNPVA